MIKSFALATCSVLASAGDIYVDVTNGNDNNEGTSPEAALATLPSAQAAAQRELKAGPLNSDLNIFVAPGDYHQTASLILSPLDSGSGPAARVHWQRRGTGKVSVNSGVSLGGWRHAGLRSTLTASSHCAADFGARVGDSVCCGQPGFVDDLIYSCPIGAPVCRGFEQGSVWGQCFDAPLPPAPVSLWEASVVGIHGAQHRHLFADGLRLGRPRLSDANREALFQGSTSNDDGFNLTGAGAEAALAWPGQPAGRHVEFAYPQQGSPWTEARCAVDNVTATDGSAFVYMMQPCYHNLRNKPCGQGSKEAPLIVENVGSAFLARPGQWSLDEVSGTVTLALAPGEDPGAMDVRMPVLETLLEMHRDVGARVKHVAFSDFTFEYATWLRPSQGDGYVEQQSGACIVGFDDERNLDCNHDDVWDPAPGNILLRGSEGITFSRCEFAHLGGGSGVDLRGGAQHNVIDGCYFHDISGAAVQIGSYGTFGITDRSQWELGNVVNNTIVDHAAAEFRGAVALSVGYSHSTRLTHNDMGNLTYGGVSVGWGWSRHPDTYAANNTIAYNRVHDYKQVLNDGGGIYLLGPQQGTRIHDNWVHDQGTASTGALYPDEGSAYMNFTDNVVTSIGSSVWLHLWTNTIHNITVARNWADTDHVTNRGTDCPMIDNHVFSPGQPPAEAQKIMDAAGVIRDGNPFASALGAGGAATSILV